MATGTINMTGYKAKYLSNSFGSTTLPIYFDAGVPKTITSYEGNAATATKLASAGTTAQFYRGDRTWSNTLTGSFALTGISEFSSYPPYYLGIEAFADGGIVKWKSAANCRVGGWITARTLTVGATGKSVDGTGNVSWTMNEIMGSSDSSKFYRGDKTWSNTLGGAFQANGTITANGGYLRSTLNGNTVTIGSANSSWCHISNSADIPFWFNKTITVDGHCNPYTNNARNLGSTSTEWANTYSRVVYARHYESSGNYTGDYNMYYGYSRCTNHYFYRGTTGGGQAHVATININGVTSNYNLGVAQTNGSDGYGLSLYAGTAHVQNYGIWCGLASKWGNYGAVTNDWNMYFGMAGAQTRGWVFRHTSSGCVASISGQGAISAVYFRSHTVQGGSWIAGTKDASFRVVSASGAGAGGYYQGWYAGKTPSGSWSWGMLSGYNDCYFCFGSDANYNAGTNSTANIKFGSNGTVYSAVWNDYAEYRMSDEKEPGRVTAPNKFGIAQRTLERLQANARIVSDTFGIAIGETDKAKTPVGLVGRVLAYPYRPIEEYHVGDCVCSAPNGTVDIMTRDEIKEWPDRIIGFVNEIPNYDIWDGTLTLPGNGKTGTTIDVKGRIWIDIK